MRKSALWILVAVPLLAGCAGAGSSTSADKGQLAIAVTEKGFEPASVTVHKGEPVTLVVTRRTDRTCAKQFVMEAMHIRKDLPLDQPVEIRFTPTQAGELRYACAMDMISGTVVVQ